MSHPVTPDTTSKRRWWPIALVALLLVMAVVVRSMLLGKKPEPAPEPTAEPSMSMSVEPTPGRTGNTGEVISAGEMDLTFMVAESKDKFYEASNPVDVNVEVRNRREVDAPISTEDFMLISTEGVEHPAGVFIIEATNDVQDFIIDSDSALRFGVSFDTPDGFKPEQMRFTGGQDVVTVNLLR